MPIQSSRHFWSIENNRVTIAIFACGSLSDFITLKLNDCPCYAKMIDTLGRLGHLLF